MFIALARVYNLVGSGPTDHEWRKSDFMILFEDLYKEIKDISVKEKKRS